ncbi:flagellar hook protein FlgE [Pseudacidobacterium ailaaui]|jgi:flagellar hook protein FlgE|uniref:flagellar hook protein FlgE n=1 Tax=Pseudacidobacterium ailaaui TaxID=1382359 RepID=UPI00047B2759|nr:flagellar hook protein FlgE [Pseudacidobacterium ailaaui]MBX6360669.1 flagellar hook protein FlgE [Pseudacidobacterium ailaaui]MCL6464834.1 flagellar hook protein FlgE [Pseudacidobacterium ailaaui]MDI3254917.1 flagellar hook protein FlgE [Bacillota bacterium]
MPSFFIPLSGLESDNTALNTIANNLANMNTVAYKSQNVQFSDLFYQQVGESGSGDPEQVGAGTKVGAIVTDFSSGTTTPSTGNPQDVALNGDGFFVVENNGTQEYTRAGNFTLGSDGHLLTQGGQQVMGYPALNGVVNTNAPLTAIQIPVGQVEQPKATSSLSVTANLDASAATGTSVQGEVTLYDSLGVSHVATVDFQKTGPGTWTYNISLPAGDSTGSVNTTGTLTFDANGNLTSPATNPTVQFTGLADGANPISFTWNLYDSSGKGTIDQVASASGSGIASITQDGYEAGQYSGFTVDSNGVVSATFSNSQTQVIGQLAVASVTNEQGLTRLGDGNYQTTLASGQATIGTAGTGGRGTIQDNAIEGSNVDISTQFADLIVAQRAFEANAKSVTTFDTVTQDTINMVH